MEIRAFHITADKIEEIGFDMFPQNPDRELTVQEIWSMAKTKMLEKNGHQNVTCWEVKK